MTWVKDGAEKEWTRSWTPLVYCRIKQHAPQSQLSSFSVSLVHDQLAERQSSILLWADTLDEAREKGITRVNGLIGTREHLRPISNSVLDWHYLLGGSWRTQIGASSFRLLSGNKYREKNARIKALAIRCYTPVDAVNSYHLIKLKARKSGLPLAEAIALVEAQARTDQPLAYLALELKREAKCLG